MFDWVIQAWFAHAHAGHRSNAPVSYPTKHHMERKCAYFCTKVVYCGAISYDKTPYRLLKKCPIDAYMLQWTVPSLVLRRSAAKPLFKTIAAYHIKHQRVIFNKKNLTNLRFHKENNFPSISYSLLQKLSLKIKLSHGNGMLFSFL